MGRFNTKFILMMIVLLGIFLLTGCNKVNSNASDGDNGKVTVVPEDKQNKSDNNSSNGDGSVSDQAPAADDELPIYTVDTQEGSGEIIPVTAIIMEGDEITPQLIVDKVVESLADQSITIGIRSVKSAKDVVIVDFKAKEAPYKSTASDYEENILNAFAQSLIDNLDNYSKVIFRVEGKAYKSADFKFGINQAYMKK